MPEHYLQADNANLCYEVEGTGPFIVIVPGGNGGSRLFRRFRDLLVEHFTVVLYDRRGYFRSNLTGPQDYSKRLETDVEDLRIIMANVTQEKFILFGISSSGALLMTYLNKYPETLLKLFVHEPMLYIDTFEGKDELQKFHLDTYNTYQTEGRNVAMEEFGNKYFNELDYYILVRKQKDDIVNNWDYWFQHEWKEYPFAKVDWKAVKTHREKTVLLYGIDSTGYNIREPGKAIAEYLNVEYLQFAGGHIGFYFESKKFFVNFIELCKKLSLLPEQQN
ncbi:Alpha/Beta hydrolase protein [Thamnidium elegans]|uniref:AB hydrolase-1 domain-containing protein n=1 Tax=Thamnidium elegans TaxID=101142 RepID=A0A8H7SJA5_9FUNG|nr:hypothetical protein INT48_002465 [Thamnidium elegans]KAI8094622.1 Alpha/Beta hydrolase protein [Thamnidium elegans]